MIAVALRPQSSIAHLNLAVALEHNGRLDEAIDECREAVRIKKDSAKSHYNLGVALNRKGRLDEAIAEYREAVRIKKDDPHAHTNLSIALSEKGQLDEAISEAREAIRIKKDNPIARFNLGNHLRDKGQLDEAITEFREAIRLKKDLLAPHGSLGAALVMKGRVDEAIDELRETIRLNRDSPWAHNDLGAALVKKGRVDEAITEFREAIRLKKDYATAHSNLGIILRRKGQLDEAITEFREAIRLKKDYREAHSELRNTLALREALAKLPAILSGRAKAENPAEQIALARACQAPYKRLYVTAAQFFNDAFAAQPSLADNLDADHRYNAACAAALAGCGQGEDTDKLDAKERARLRRQALDFLRADLRAYRQMMEKPADNAGLLITRRMQHWLRDSDFAGVRGDNALAKLPDEERSAWRKLWADVAEMLAKAQGKAPPEKKPDTK